MPFNEIIHQSLRLRIMAKLVSRPAGAAPLEFSALKASLGATDGNLGSHLATLQRAGYVSTDKRFIERKPRTLIAATASGREAFADHVAALAELLVASD